MSQLYRLQREHLVLSISENVQQYNWSYHFIHFKINSVVMTSTNLKLSWKKKEQTNKWKVLRLQSRSSAFNHFTITYCCAAVFRYAEKIFKILLIIFFCNEDYWKCITSRILFKEENLMSIFMPKLLKYKIIWIIILRSIRKLNTF